MSTILNVIKNKKSFSTRVETVLIKEAVLNFLLAEYKDYFNTPTNCPGGFLRDNIELYNNDCEDIAISFDESLKNLENILREHDLITEANNNRATNLCCKAISKELGCSYDKVDIWTTTDDSYIRLLLPVEIFCK